MYEKLVIPNCRIRMPSPIRNKGPPLSPSVVRERVRRNEEESQSLPSYHSRTLASLALLTASIRHAFMWEAQRRRARLKLFAQELAHTGPLPRRALRKALRHQLRLLRRRRVWTPFGSRPIPRGDHVRPRLGHVTQQDRMELVVRQWLPQLQQRHVVPQVATRSAPSVMHHNPRKLQRRFRHHRVARA
ncbi:unnamed protein product [Chondrus crispus]|uniref:Uncharacterized protein n=1 Tax=Chondrus crispus TaxID=2769 RepID=R7QJH6_CHOCR|nr:unnamed protein product [Chondrus crispus]CDF37616.1 unnamed protein product [Chondrus crispus]|eukprot:XP_005717487.1 unnamed protein product [Chondrus crispus]